MLSEMLMFGNVFCRPAKSKSYFGTTPSARRKHFIVDARHFMPVYVAGVVKRGVDSRLMNGFAWFKLRRHFEAPINSPRVLFSNETLLKQLDQITIGDSINSAPVAFGSFGWARSILASYFQFRGTRRIPMG